MIRVYLLEGGEGSGNHGHSGRPGQKGGSGPKGVTADLERYLGDTGRFEYLGTTTAASNEHYGPTKVYRCKLEPSIARIGFENILQKHGIPYKPLVWLGEPDKKGYAYDTSVGSFAIVHHVNLSKNWGYMDAENFGDDDE